MKLKFVPLEKENEAHYRIFEGLMLMYIRELKFHQNEDVEDSFIKEVTHIFVSKLGPSDRHLELCYDGENLVGFIYVKVDHEGDKGDCKPGYGYIMEFYVRPELRRQGYGREMYKHIEEIFVCHGVKRMWLTSDPVTGKPFWLSLGFVSNGEIASENGLMIYEKVL